MENVKNGKYQLGDLIEPKTYKKYALDANGKITELSYTVAGRKIPLNVIRENLYKEHVKLGIIRPTKIINRNLIVWADHASVLSYGFLLITIKVIYSKTLFYTDLEMKELTGKTHDVQKLVETPSIYILGQTRDCISEKLTYIDTRIEDIQQLKIHIELEDEKIIKDTMRFFQGC